MEHGEGENREALVGADGLLVMTCYWIREHITGFLEIAEKFSVVLTARRNNNHGGNFREIDDRKEK